MLTLTVNERFNIDGGFIGKNSLIAECTVGESTDIFHWNPKNLPGDTYQLSLILVENLQFILMVFL